MVTAKLICFFVFAYAKSWVSYDEAHISMLNIGALTWHSSLVGSATAPDAGDTKIDPTVSGIFFRKDLVMKMFLRPFFLLHLFKKNSCQLMAKDGTLSTGKLPLGGLPWTSVVR